ncbi:hypothetical protein F4694_003859 [Bacillus niacini]|uniref:Uncharacterized protein n=1 Tax=Neobacillus niacini TaxID=86668 RepID=A0A852TIY9_9BACI|nr:hypothetical protein [Neobacillus niacini]NYE07074.1 hypothetical protein [Neobacillus niacini]
MYEITVRLPTKKIERIITHLYQKGITKPFMRFHWMWSQMPTAMPLLRRGMKQQNLIFFINDYIEARERRQLVELLAIETPCRNITTGICDTFLALLWCFLIMKVHTLLVYNGGEPWMYIYGKDYINYLNDDKMGLLTYDQWKNKNSLKGSDKGNLTEEVKTTRYTEGNYSPSVFNKIL